jgi:peptidoglycan hydrolase-like amidase
MSPGRNSSFIPTNSVARALKRARSTLLSILALPLAAQGIQVGVFGLFHSQTFTVRSCSSAPVLAGIQLIEGTQTATITSPTRVTSPSGGRADILLAIPGKIERCYHGTLDIRHAPHADELVAIIGMDLETAVASIVAAEQPPGTPLEALKAQAVVARSFLTASPPRHRDFQFCDTTHCQFLRETPLPRSAPARAAELTTGLLLTYEGVPIAPQYSAACGGRTIASAAHDYPYQSVRCEYCQRHPTEPVRGHRLGMCQVGASRMAAEGVGFREILNHYYPGTAVKDFPAR